MTEKKKLTKTVAPLFAADRRLDDMADLEAEFRRLQTLTRKDEGLKGQLLLRRAETDTGLRYTISHEPKQAGQPRVTKEWNIMPVRDSTGAYKVQRWLHHMTPAAAQEYRESAEWGKQAKDILPMTVREISRDFRKGIISVAPHLQRPLYDALKRTTGLLPPPLPAAAP